MNAPIQQVLLANGFFLNNDPKQIAEKFKPYPPLATLYAAASLQSLPLQVSLFDATLAADVSAFSQQFATTSPDLLVICEDSFNFLSKMCLSHVRDTSLQMITIAKAANCKVVVNSSDAADAPKVYLEGGADYVIVGEIEQTLVELVQWLNNETATQQQLPAGLIYNTLAQWGRTQRRKNNRHIDDLPQPAWSLVDVAAYRNAWQRYHGYYGVNMVTTRGCPYRCNWCAKPIWGQQYVSHSPQYIVAQLKQIIQQSKPDHIWFADDIFGLKRGWIEAFAQCMAAEQLQIPFMIQTRADLMTPSAIAGLQSAGCQQVWLGVESGSQIILDAMDKDLNLDQVQQARQDLARANISTGFFIQLGYLAEDIPHLQQTRDMIMTLRPEEIGVSVSYPLPGTEFFNKVKQGLGDKTHWQHSNDLDAVFKSTFSSDFYRLLRDHLHQELNALLAQPDCAKTQTHWQQQWQKLLSSAGQYRHRVDVCCINS